MLWLLSACVEPIPFPSPTPTDLPPPTETCEDALDGASALPLGDTPDLRVDGDGDLYTITVPPLGNLVVLVSGAVEVEVAGEKSTDGVSWRNDGDEAAVVEVAIHSTTGNCETYSLRTSLAGVACPDDGAEPNDTRAEAYPWDGLENLTVTAADPDWHQVLLLPHHGLDVTFAGPDGVEVRIHDEVGPRPAGRVPAANVARDLWVEVSTGAPGCHDYSLTMTGISSPACTDEEIGNVANDYRLTAPLLSYGSTTGFAGPEGDVWRISVPLGEDAIFNVDGDVRYLVTDARGERLFEGLGTDDTNYQLTNLWLEEQVYFLVFFGTCETYQVSLSEAESVPVDCAFPAACVCHDDGPVVTAVDGPGTLSGVAGAGIDVFELLLPPGQRATVFSYQAEAFWSEGGGYSGRGWHNPSAVPISVDLLVPPQQCLPYELVFEFEDPCSVADAADAQPGGQLFEVSTATDSNTFRQAELGSDRMVFNAPSNESRQIWLTPSPTMARPVMDIRWRGVEYVDVPSFATGGEVAGQGLITLSLPTATFANACAESDILVRPAVAAP